MSLRPALKACTDGDRAYSSPLPFASSKVMDALHVHFPPTPTLTSTALTHSPNVYDRAPIEVAPNTCALPERGERVYSSDDEDVDVSPISAREIGGYFQFLPPRTERMHSLQALWAAEGHSSSTQQLPPTTTTRTTAITTLTPNTSHDRYDMSSPLLVSDISSESEDSDQCRSPGPPTDVPYVSVQLSNSSTPYPYGGVFARQQGGSVGAGGVDSKELAIALEALPYSKVKKHRQKDSSSNVAVEDGDGCPKRRTRRKDSLPAGERTRKLSATRQCITTFTSSSDDLASEGCLGGF